MLGVSSAGYYLAKIRPMSPTKIRREWLTGLIREVHADSRGTYGARSVRAELTKGRAVYVSRGLVRIPLRTLQFNEDLASLRDVNRRLNESDGGHVLLTKSLAHFSTSSGLPILTEIGDE